MKKKLLIILTACALACTFAFTACGGGSGATPDSTGDGDKTEQSGTPVKPDDKGEDKTEQTEKPEGNKTEDDKKPDNSDDKTSDDKTPDGDKTGDEEEKKDESKNAYREVIDALQTKLDVKYGEGAEILTLYTYVQRTNTTYLKLKIKYGNTIKDLTTGIDIQIDDTGYISNDEFTYLRNMISSPKTNLTESGRDDFVGLYLTDSESATDAALAKTMIESRIGTDFDIICGGVSEVTDVASDYMISNAAKFTVYALLADKDGKVSEYTETLIASKDNGNVYDAVIYGGSFRSEKHTQTELGALADNYYAEQVRLAKLNQNQTATE